MTTSTEPVPDKKARLAAATYTVPQAADRAQISPRTMWRRIDLNEVPGVIRIGRSVRISKALFDAWIDGGAK